MTRPVDADERASVALDMLLASLRERPLPTLQAAPGVVAQAVALADAFLSATLPPADLDEAPDPDPHGLIEYAIAFAPTVHIGNAIVPVYLLQEADEAFRFQGRRAVLLGLAGLEFDNPDEAFDELRRIEAERADDVEMGERLGRPAPEEAEKENCGKSCEGCGYVPCAGRGGPCPGRMSAPTRPAGEWIGETLPEAAVAAVASEPPKHAPSSCCRMGGAWIRWWEPSRRWFLMLGGRNCNGDFNGRAVDTTVRHCPWCGMYLGAAPNATTATAPSLRDRILAALAEGAAEFVACGYPHCSGDRGHMANAIERLLAQPDVLALLLAQSEAKAQPPIADVAVDALSDRRF